MSLAQAAAITEAIAELPDDLPADIRRQAERELVGYAGRFDAKQLIRLGQHILTAVAPEIGEARDAEALERQEQQPGGVVSCSSHPTVTAPCTSVVD